MDVYHQDRNEQWRKVGINDQKIVKVNKGYGVLPLLSKIPTYYINFRFDDGKSYNIGFFAGVEARDLAFRLISSAKEDQSIYLSQYEYFRYTTLTKNQIKKICERYKLPEVLKIGIARICNNSNIFSHTSIEAFVTLFNANMYTQSNLRKEELVSILNGIFPSTLNRYVFAGDLALLMPMPKNKKLKIAPTIFWNHLIRKLK